jgi:SAM-dependent methyltransferase
MNTSFEALVAEADKAATDNAGWDWSWMSGRMTDEDPSWDYPGIVREALHQVQSLLDIGTGGGEFLSTLLPLPAHTTVTESYGPSVVAARQRLAPLGVTVVESRDLPFEDQSFDLITNRHSELKAGEIFRVLRPGGKFITQQVGEQNDVGLRELLGLASIDTPGRSREVMQQDFEQAGLVAISISEEFPVKTYNDIGAVVWYLSRISWAILDFSVDSYRDRLLDLHQKIETDGPVSVCSHRILLQAKKA